MSDARAALMAALPEAQRKHLDPASPGPMRMMAARGMAPLPPREMVIVLCGLTFDDDAKLSQAATVSLAKLPETIVGAALDKDLPEAALTALVPALGDKEPLLEKVVLSRKTPDVIVAAVAGAASERVLEIILGDQERALRSEAIVRAAASNQAALRSSLDRLFDFLVRSGVIYDDMPQFGDALARLSPTERQEAADNIVLPPEAQALLDHSRDEAVDTSELEKDLESVIEDESAKERVPVMKLIGTLTVAQRIALALKGNKEARTILIRDTNKMVASATIRSPRITDQEVAAAAASRSVSDEVIRIISGTKEMTRTYGVKYALVNNPKTPLPVAMKFLGLLRDTDLKTVAKSRNIPSALANQAKRLMLNKGR